MFKNYCIIFDMDGVLADTGPIHFESWVKMAKEIGFNFTKQFFEETFGQTTSMITRKLVGSAADKISVERWGQIKEQYYREMIKDKLEPLPGVKNLIQDLKLKGFKLAIGSSGPPENVELLLNTLNIKKCFDIIITAADVNKGKPSPDVFLIMSKKLNLRPEHCLIIEDAPVGIEAAKRANMKCIALTTTHGQEDLKDAELIVKDLTEIHINDILLLFEILHK